MKHLAFILFLLLPGSSYAQDCSTVIRDTAIVGNMMRSYQDVATLATIDTSTTIYNLWAEKRDNAIFFKAEKVEAKSDVLLVGERTEGRAYVEFIFADASVRVYVPSDWRWTKRYNLQVSDAGLLNKLATQPLIGLNGYSEQVTADAQGKRARTKRSPHYIQDVSFSFDHEEALKLTQAFSCLQGKPHNSDIVSAAK